MPLIQCPDCGHNVSTRAAVCPQCGGPVDVATTPATTPARLVPRVVKPVEVSQATERNIYVIAGIFLGMLGVHNFYAERYSRGAAQILLSVLLCWTFVVPVVVWLWALVEVCTIREDGNGKPMV